MTPTSPSKSVIRVPAIVRHIVAWRESFDTGELAGIQPNAAEGRVQYKHKHRSLKVKGGSRPREFNLIDSLVDLDLALKQHDWETALSTYFYLRRMIDGPR